MKYKIEATNLSKEVYSNFNTSDKLLFYIESSFALTHDYDFRQLIIVFEKARGNDVIKWVTEYADKGTGSFSYHIQDDDFIETTITIEPHTYLYNGTSLYSEVKSDNSIPTTIHQ